jgi:enoyl-CoA hydratase/carnithine racemase
MYLHDTLVKELGMASEDLVLVDVDQGVALVSLNRPDRNNAWNLELETAYFRVLDDLDEDERVRAIVVTGIGRSFCPGIDVTVLQARTTGDATAYGARSRRPLAYPLTVRKPLIAAINGGCAGVGLFQAVLCDVRFIADEAKLASGQTTRGLPAEFGLSWLLPRMIGHAAAADLLLSGRPVKGPEAVRLGLASASVPREQLVDHALEYARRLARECSPAAMAVVKSREGAEEGAARLALLLQAGGDFAEGVNSFVERRTAQFAPLGARATDTITPSISSQLEVHLPA